MAISASICKPLSQIHCSIYFSMVTRISLILQALSLAYKYITLVIFYLPVWILLSFRKASRPRPSWTLARTLAVKAFQYTSVLEHVDILQGAPNWHNLQQGVNGVWIPATPHLIVGDVKKWADIAKVDSIRIPAYWIDRPGSVLPSDARPRPGQKVLYALHGGCYALYSAHPSSAPSHISRGILAHCSTTIWRSLVLEYRLTSHPSAISPNPFPAALLDAIAGYNYLVNEGGVAPEDIIVEGDSAGGNLALALTRYLIENQGRKDIGLPAPPGALILCSPWVDLGPTSSDRLSSSYTNVSSDIIDLSDPSFRACCTNFCSALGASAMYTNRYISPASQSPAMLPVSFRNFPRTYILSAGAEVLRDQIHVLRRKMENDMGADLVKFVEFPDAFHAFLWFPYVSEPESTEAFQSIAEWLYNKC